MSRKILITGGAGFVGSSLALLFKQHHKDYTVVALDNLKRRGSELNLPRLKAAGIQFVHGDIRNKSDFDSLDRDFTTIIEASAEPSVLAGLNGSPDYLIDTNLNGTINCLSFARASKADFIFLSTSRVYPIETLERASFREDATRFSLTDNQPVPGLSAKGISESFPLEGYRSLYGATKLASELIIHEFNQFYGVKTVINRCGVLTGPWQMGKVDQGVIVLWLARHFWKGKLGYFGYGGTGKQLRDILHVNDLYSLVDMQVNDIGRFNNRIFNAGGGVDVSVSLQELTKLCEEVTGNRITIDEVKDNRQADIRIYVTDNTTVNKVCGWEPKITVKEIVTDIFGWLKQNEHALAEILK